jgi:hypothetical protein
MPRLTNQRYLLIHHQLRQVWIEDRSGFSWLRPAEQWQLHDYFRPSKDLTDAELFAHRAAISQEGSVALVDRRWGERLIG